jgi:hypothetical protein
MSRARDVSNIDNIPTAKGDIYAATAASTPARIGVGSNGDTLIADSSTSTGLRWNPLPAAGKNFLLNADMSIAQRGTSSALVGNSYRLDRWAASQSQQANHQQITTGSTTVPAYYALRAGSVTTAQSAGGARVQVAQQIETLLAQNLAGRTVTLSFWVRFSAATIANAGNWSYNVTTSTSADPSISTQFATYPISVQLTNGSFPTTWTKYSATGTLATNTRSIRLMFEFPNLFATTNANDAYFDITAVQLELGSVATEFTLNTGNPASELAACQRYYMRYSFDAINTWMGVGNAGSGSTTQFYPMIKLSVPMRIKPQSVDYSGLGWWNGGNQTSVSSITINAANPDFAMLTANTTGLTANNVYMLGSATTSAYLGFSAEL